jgi:hypothetical protein
MAHSPFLLPLLVPCQFPFHSLLLTRNPSFGVMRSRPPWPQVARKLTSPSPIPSPFQIPSTPDQSCALLRRHRDSGFTGSGTGSTEDAVLSTEDAVSEASVPNCSEKGPVTSRRNKRDLPPWCSDNIGYLGEGGASSGVAGISGAMWNTQKSHIIWCM